MFLYIDFSYYKILINNKTMIIEFYFILRNFNFFRLL